MKYTHDFENQYLLHLFKSYSNIADKVRHTIDDVNNDMVHSNIFHDNFLMKSINVDNLIQNDVNDLLQSSDNCMHNNFT